MRDVTHDAGDVTISVGGYHVGHDLLQCVKKLIAMCDLTHDAGDVKISVGDCETVKITAQLDLVQLSIFSHRFMSIAEQVRLICGKNT